MEFDSSELFYSDPYAAEFEASVVSCAPGKKGYEIVLDRTAFYPEGGGQPADLGFLNEIRVTHVKRTGGLVIHCTEQPVEPGTPVRGKIDWDRRFSNMQNHTGEHIISGLIHKKFGYDNVGFHMEDGCLTIDFDGPITDEELKEIERSTNAVIAANVPVNIRLLQEGEGQDLEYRSKKELKGPIRLVEIPDADCCACCGTHVKSTAEVGFLKCLSMEKHRGGVRIQFVCGLRAVNDYEKRIRQDQKLSELLSKQTFELVAGVERLQSEIQEKKEEIYALNNRYFRLSALHAAAENGVCAVFDENLPAGVLRRFCDILAETQSSADTCAVFSSDGSGRMAYVLSSRTRDLKTLGKAFNAKLSGRGGGSGGVIQGTVQGSEAEITAVLQEIFG